MEEMKLPYVSKELVDYLRETYSLPMVLRTVQSQSSNADMALGALNGINYVIENLEGLVKQQEGD